jgi:hypothetical protein
MKNTITLANGGIPPRVDRISVELSGTGLADRLSTIMINWPQHATITTSASYDNVIAVVTRLLAAASIELAALSSEAAVMAGSR